jgi:hypothetical protein
MPRVYWRHRPARLRRQWRRTFAAAAPQQDFYTLNFATRLYDIGFYYGEFERPAAHWRATFPAPILEVRYEELVANPEAATRRLLEFCGLN